MSVHVCLCVCVCVCSVVLICCGGFCSHYFTYKGSTDQAVIDGIRQLSQTDKQTDIHRNIITTWLMNYRKQSMFTSSRWPEYSMNVTNCLICWSELLSPSILAQQADAEPSNYASQPMTVLAIYVGLLLLLLVWALCQRERESERHLAGFQ